MQRLTDSILPIARIAAIRRAHLTVVVLAICIKPSSAQDEPSVIDALKSEATAAVQAYHLSIGGDPERVAELVPEPLISFVMRRVDGAFIFLWVEDNRPVAVAQIYHRLRLPDLSPIWIHEFVSLSPDELELKSGGQVLWAPKGPGLEWHELPDAPPLTSIARLRHSQWKQLVRRFEASEQMISGGMERTFDLNLKPRELVAYSVDDDEVPDGALFWYARADGNDPELLVGIEARPAGADGDIRWHYATTPFTTLPLEVHLDDSEVLSLPSRLNGTSIDDPHHVWSFND